MGPGDPSDSLEGREGAGLRVLAMSGHLREGGRLWLPTPFVQGVGGKDQRSPSQDAPWICYSVSGARRVTCEILS